jgi:hypothetical protein
LIHSSFFNCHYTRIWGNPDLRHLPVNFVYKYFFQIVRKRGVIPMGFFFTVSRNHYKKYISFLLISSNLSYIHVLRETMKCDLTFHSRYKRCEWQKIGFSNKELNLKTSFMSTAKLKKKKLKTMKISIFITYLPLYSVNITHRIISS